MKMYKDDIIYILRSGATVNQSYGYTAGARKLKDKGLAKKSRSTGRIDRSIDRLRNLP